MGHVGPALFAVFATYDHDMGQVGRTGADDQVTGQASREQSLSMPVSVQWLIPTSRKPGCVPVGRPREAADRDSFSD